MEKECVTEVLWIIYFSSIPSVIFNWSVLIGKCWLFSVHVCFEAGEIASCSCNLWESLKRSNIVCLFVCLKSTCWKSCCRVLSHVMWMFNFCFVLYFVLCFLYCFVLFLAIEQFLFRVTTVFFDSSHNLDSRFTRFTRSMWQSYIISCFSP